MSTKAFSILLAIAVVIQSFLGGIAGAGTLCLGGGHDHPEGDIAQSCELDCSHASSLGSIPSPVMENHSDCSCVDIDLSISELLTTPPRFDTYTVSDATLLSAEPMLIPLVDWGWASSCSRIPKWFDPGGTQRVANIATTRLIV